MRLRNFVIIFGILVLATPANAQFIAQRIAVNNSGWRDDGSTVRLKTQSDNVGIGTTDPQVKLEVNGGIRINTTDFQPICDDLTRGTFWFNQDDQIGDSMEVCKSIGMGGINAVNANLPSARVSFSCAKSSARDLVYCFGGNNDAGVIFDENIEYDPINVSTTTKANLPSVRRLLSCTESKVNDLIYCFGGETTSGVYLNEIIEYDPFTNSIVVKGATLPSARADFSCVDNSLTGKIYCFGGVGTDEILEYSPLTDTIQVMSAKLPTARTSHSCAENSQTNKIYCFGGVDSTFLDEIVEYDPSLDTITTMNAVLPTPRVSLACEENKNNHKIYCFSGFDTVALNEIIEYDPEYDQVSITNITLPSPRVYTTCSGVASSEQIYCFGGYDGSASLNEILEFSAGGFRWKMIK